MEDSQIFILADYYTNRYDVPDAWMDVTDVSKRHGKEKKYNLFRVLCCHIGIIDQSNKKINVIQIMINIGD